MTQAEITLRIADIQSAINRRMDENRADYHETRRKLKMTKDEQLFALENAKEKYLRHYAEQRKAINTQYDQVVGKALDDFKQMQRDLDNERCRMIAELKEIHQPTDVFGNPVNINPKNEE